MGGPPWGLVITFYTLTINNNLRYILELLLDRSNLMTKCPPDTPQLDVTCPIADCGPSGFM